MSDAVHVEIERKYDVDGQASLPRLNGVGGVAQVRYRPPVALEAVYFDTADDARVADDAAVQRHGTHHGQVVADEQIAHAVVALQLREQRQHLLLVLLERRLQRGHAENFAEHLDERVGHVGRDAPRGEAEHDQDEGEEHPPVQKRCWRDGRRGVPGHARPSSKGVSSLRRGGSIPIAGCDRTSTGRFAPAARGRNGQILLGIASRCRSMSSRDLFVRPMGESPTQGDPDAIPV